jgi:hypothetical protein
VNELKTAWVTRLLAAALSLVFVAGSIHTTAHLAAEHHHHEHHDHHHDHGGAHEHGTAHRHDPAPENGDALAASANGFEHPSHDPHAASDHRKESVSAARKKQAVVRIDAHLPVTVPAPSNDSEPTRTAFRSEPPPPESSPPSPRQPRAPPLSSSIR